MGRLSAGFARFPHRCVIFRSTGDTPFSEGVRDVLWQGRCRRESNTSVRTFTGSEHVIKADYRVQLGALVGGELDGDMDAAPDGRDGEETGALVRGLRTGDHIDVEDGSGLCEYSVSDVYQGTLGTSVYCNRVYT